MTVREAGALLRKQKASCVELVDDAIRRAKQQESLRAFITLTETQARNEAGERDQELRAGRDRGPFHGIPIAYKDLFYTKGVRTTGGSLPFRDFVPGFDAPVVERLHKAGAISIGKTNLHELALGITSLNPHFGHVLNPLDKGRLAGGSSGGSGVAIASGSVPMALGTDTGGSIRIPASFCGVVGLKPTYGRLSRRGVLPLSFSLDHVGPLGLTVEDCALAMNAMAGPDRQFQASKNGHGRDFNLPPLSDLKGVRIGLPANFFFERAEESVVSAVKRSAAECERHGAIVSEIAVPDFGEMNAVARIIQLSEFAALYVAHHDSALFGEDVWSLLEQGRMLSAHEYVNAQRLRTLFRSEFDSLWRRVDLLMSPTTPVSAPLIGQETVMLSGHAENVRLAATRLVRGFNLLGEPAVSLPCGKSNDGMPIGLQMVSAPFSEPRLLQLAKTVENLLGRFSFERQT